MTVYLNASWFQKGTFDELPNVLNVKELQEYLNNSLSSTYDLMHRADFPTLHVISIHDRAHKHIRMGRNEILVLHNVDQFDLVIDLVDFGTVFVGRGGLNLRITNA